MFKKVSFLLLAAIGIYGYIYSYPIIKRFLDGLNDDVFFIVVPMLCVAVFFVFYLIWILISLIDEEIEGRRVGDVKIDGELLEDFRMEDFYFSTEDRLNKKD